MKKLLIGLSVFTTAFVVDDVLTKTGTNDAAIKKSIVTAALWGSEDGRFPQYFANSDGEYLSAYKMTRTIILNQRAGIVNEMGAYFKTYYNSPAFKKDFAAALESFKPGDAPKDSAALKAQYEADVKAAKEGYEKAIKAFDEADKAMTQANTSLSASQAAMDKIDKMIKDHPEMLAQSGMTAEEFKKQMLEAQQAMGDAKKEVAKTREEEMTPEKKQEQLKEAEDNYKEKLAQLKTDLANDLTNLPAKRIAYNEKVALYKIRSNYKLNIKTSLQHFLNATTDVDFNATIKRQGSTDYFSNASYERKNNVWKACFRAGKDATDAARTFAQQWAGELK